VRRRLVLFQRRLLQATPTTVVTLSKGSTLDANAQGSSGPTCSQVNLPATSNTNVTRAPKKARDTFTSELQIKFFIHLLSPPCMLQAAIAQSL